VADLLTALANVSHGRRRDILQSLPPADRAWLVERVVERETMRRFVAYRDRPTEFVTELLGETIWSKQAEVLNAIRDHRRVAVPASHSVSKTHTAARVAAWWCSVYDPGTSLVITTAPTFRQVRNVLWPHIRRLRDRHNLPGEANLTEWKIGSEMVAFGFSAADNDESAVQGFHQANLLVIVDEAGGIGHTLGNALESVLTGGNTRLLLIGNPPTDEEQSWFEQACSDPAYHVVRIGANDSPNLSGEDPGLCHACPSASPPHPLASHLVDGDWVARQVNRFGPDSAFVEARVHARFPRGVADKVIPWSWVEAALGNDGADTTTGVRFGVDVAADGGDEFVVARADGWRVRVVHRSSGEANASQVEVAGVVKRLVLEAEAQAKPGDPRVRVKIDAIGIGRGTSDLLQAWSAEGLFGALIVPVNVAEKARASEHKNQRAEMWWTGRELVQPDSVTGLPRVWLDVDEDAAAQLTGPKYSTDSAGRITIEGKPAMKRRGLSSPDRAEAVLLALFEPPGKRRPSAVVSGGTRQRNEWSI
jgi:hypothetical protein